MITLKTLAFSIAALLVVGLLAYFTVTRIEQARWKMVGVTEVGR
jgi:hypothetical protein